MHNIFVSAPSVRGLDPDMAWGTLFNLRTEVEALGHRLHGASVKRMPLDYVRNEMLTIFMSTTCDLNLCIDDDIVLEKGIDQMLKLIDAGCDIVTAPCRLRDHSHTAAWTPFNIFPNGAPYELDGVPVVECDWTGLGLVLVRRSVYEKLFEAGRIAARKPPCASCGHAERALYRSYVLPERTSLALYRSEVVQARTLDARAPENQHVYLLDDRVFSMKVRAAGFKIHAAIGVRTSHDGMRGCFLEELQKHDAARTQRGGRDVLLDSSGKPVMR